MKGNHLFDGDLVAGGVDDEEVAIDGDEQDREGGEEDARGLDDPRQLAQDFLIMVVVVMRVVTMMVVMVIKMVPQACTGFRVDKAFGLEEKLNQRQLS